jgi:PII-like signaling protein
LDLPRQATLATVYVNASDRVHGKPIYRALVEAARSMQLRGASVFLVDFSYGSHRQIHDAKNEYLSFQIPVVVEFVDSSPRIAALLERCDAWITEGLVVTRGVQVIRDTASDESSPASQSVTSSVSSQTPQLESEPAMRIEGAAQRLCIYIGSSDTYHGRNLVSVIVEECRKLGIAGATATLGVMGFGKNSRIHRAHFLGLSEDLPQKIEIVDQPEQIARVLPILNELIQGGLMTLEEVHVVRYLHDPSG